MLRCLILRQLAAATSLSTAAFAGLMTLVGAVAFDRANAQGRPEITLFAEDIGPRYTSNAFLSETNAKSDIFTSPSYGLKVRGDLAQGLSYGLAAFVTNTRFLNFSQLDDDTVGLSSSLTYRMGSWAIKAGYSPSWIFARGFEGAPVEFHDLSMALIGGYKVGSVTISPTLGVRRRFSNLEIYEATRLGAGIEFSWNLTPKIGVAIAPGATHTIYDAAVAGADRRDTFVGLNAELTWQLNPFATLIFGAAVGHNESTIGGRSWNSFGASPTLTLATKF
jgi:hypothetical protein